MSGEHYKFSASSAERWLTCLNSIDLLDAHPRPEEEGDGSARGTTIHDLGERLLKGEPLPEGTSPEHEAIAKSYVGAVEAIESGLKKPQRSVEFKVAYSVEGEKVGGTPDCAVIGEDAITGDVVLHIIDLKTGHKGAEVKSNKQLMIYVLDWVKYLERMQHEVAETHLHIHHQADESEEASENAWSVYKVSKAELDELEAEIQTAVYAYNEGKGDFKVGEHCSWCNKAVCPAYNSQLTDVSKTVVAKTSTEHLIKMLDLAPHVTKALKEAKSMLLERWRQGEVIPGMKAVKTLANRSYIDESDVELTFGSKATEINLLSPAKLEKKLDKKGKELLSTMVERKEKGVSLVSQSNKGIAIAPPKPNTFTGDEDVEQELN